MNYKDIMTPIPNPGSEAALARGCKCPVVDNHYGNGFDLNGEIVFWFNGDCPIHDSKNL